MSDAKTRHTTLSPIPLSYIPGLVRYCHTHGMRCFTLGGTIRDVIRDVAIANNQPLSDQEAENKVQTYCEMIMERYHEGKAGV